MTQGRELYLRCVVKIELVSQLTEYIYDIRLSGSSDVSPFAEVPNKGKDAQVEEETSHSHQNECPAAPVLA